MCDATGPVDRDEISAHINRYHRAMRAVQSATAFRVAHGNPLFEPKLLRDAIDTAQIDANGLARLLVDKGIITRVEYLAALADSAEREQMRHEFEQDVKFG